MFSENRFHFVCVGLYRRIRTISNSWTSRLLLCCSNHQWHLLRILHLSTAHYQQYNAAQSKDPRHNWTRFSLPLGWNVDPVSLKRLDCHLTGFDGQEFSVCAFIFCPFINPVYIPAASHPSIHPSVHRAFLARASVMTSAELGLIYRHLKETSLMLQFIIYHLFFYRPQGSAMVSWQECSPPLVWLSNNHYS